MGYASTMGFSREQLEAIDRTEEVHIETRDDAGTSHRTIIWAVVDDDDVFIRSYRGPNARWYREALTDASVVLHVDGLVLPATAVPTHDPRDIERCSAALLRKYPEDPATPRMVRPEILDLTLRLDPA
jgi:hypothetical protein